MKAKYQSLLLFSVAFSAFFFFTACYSTPTGETGTSAVQRTTTTNAPKPKELTAEDCGCDVLPPAGPQIWATVLGQKFFDTDFKAALAPQIDPQIKKLKEMRLQGIDTLIIDRILEKEAGAVKLDVPSYIRKFVDPKVKDVTEAEINDWFAKNPGGPTDSAARFRVKAWLKDQKRIETIKATAESMKKNHRISVMTAANTADAEGQRVLALLDEEPIRKADLDEFLKAQLYDIKKQIYNIRKMAVDQRAFPLLLEAEAKRRSTTVQILINTEILDKAPMATSQEIESVYYANKFPKPLEQMRGEIANHLRQQAIAKQEQLLFADLAKKDPIQYSLPGIVEPTFKIETMGKPSKGSPNAPVTIVEFSDYECPYCAQIQPVLNQLLNLYAGKVRLVAREFPIVTHQFSRKASQAALSAHSQGKYFEYTALLYRNQLDLSEPALIRLAQQVGLNIAQLKADIAANRYDTAIDLDMDDAKRVGLTSTPTFFINGRRLEQITLQGFKEAIERELSRTSPAAAPARKSRASAGGNSGR